MKKKAATKKSLMTVLVSSDHAGRDLKAELKKLVPEIAWKDLGPKDGSTGEVDYPDSAVELTSRIAAGEADRGVLVCGTGIGMSIAANKFQGIYAAVVSDPVSARLAREHNQANVLCLGARIIAPHYAAEIVRAWLNTKASSEARHLHRIEQIKKFEIEGMTS